MPSVPDLNNKNAWDDSLLINSWDDAVAEYEKYHSIAKSGRQLEDVLTDEELGELREDHGNLIGERRAETTPGADEPHASSDAMDLESPNDKMNGVAGVGHQATQPQEVKESGSAQENVTEHVAAQSNPQAGIAGSVPQALLGTVQDDNMKNLMMAWYYAGYYTAKQEPKGAAPEQ